MLQSCFLRVHRLFQPRHGSFDIVSVLNHFGDGVGLDASAESANLVPREIENGVDGFETAAGEFGDKCPVRALATTIFRT